AWADRPSDRSAAEVEEDSRPHTERSGAAATKPVHRDRRAASAGRRQARHPEDLADSVHRVDRLVLVPEEVEESWSTMKSSFSHQVRNVQPWRPAASMTRWTEASTCSPVRVSAGERKTRVIVRLLTPLSSGLPR